MILRLGYICNCNTAQPGSISGAVYNRLGTPLVGAPVQACPATGLCSMTLTDNNGAYYIPTLENGGAYTVRSWPAGTEPFGAGRIGTLTIPAGGGLTDQDIVLEQLGVPNGVTLQPMLSPYQINWQDSLTLQTMQTPGGTASYEIEHEVPPSARAAWLKGLRAPTTPASRPSSRCMAGYDLHHHRLS